MIFKLENHTTTDCEMILETCKYSIIGCKFKVCGRDIVYITSQNVYNNVVVLINNYKVIYFRILFNFQKNYLAVTVRYII